VGGSTKPPPLRPFATSAPYPEASRRALPAVSDPPRSRSGAPRRPKSQRSYLFLGSAPQVHPRMPPSKHRYELLNSRPGEPFDRVLRYVIDPFVGMCSYSLSEVASSIRAEGL
jgi:hypothetical protein